MRKEATRIVNSVLMVICVLTLLICVDIYGARAVELEKQTEDLKRKTEELESLLTKSNELMLSQSELIVGLQQKQQQPPQIEEQVNRGEERGECRTMEITAYDLSYQSCGKYPDHPLYGVTASGGYVEAWNTIAAGPEFPFGTKVYIPYFKDAPNQGVFTVHDRGGAIKNGRIDVYMESYDDCMDFGRRELEVYILE